MTLILDTGPLFAALDYSDRHHAACRGLIESAQRPLVIPAPVLVELDHLIQARLQPEVMRTVIDDIFQFAYTVQDVTVEDFGRISEILATYADSRIGFVDAAVLAVVERLGEPKLATLDHRHFGMMRPRHVQALRLLPE